MNGCNLEPELRAENISLQLWASARGFAAKCWRSASLDTYAAALAMSAAGSVVITVPHEPLLGDDSQSKARAKLPFLPGACEL